MAISRRTTTTALAGFGIAALLLTGCAAGGSADPAASTSSSASPDSKSDASGSDASGQSKADACDVVKAGVSDTVTQLQGGIGELQTDPAAAAAAVDELATAFKTTGEDVTNDDVRAVVDKATAALTAFSTQIQSYAADPAAADPAAVQESATAVQEALLKLGTTCA